VLALGAISLVAIVPLVAAPWEAPRPKAEDRGSSRASGLPLAQVPPGRTKTPRFREGNELVDQVGHFESAGERLVFVAEPGGERLVALENLNLERVARAVAGYPGQLDWLIAGTVTEYRGTCFLLIERAVVKTGARALGQ